MAVSSSRNKIYVLLIGVLLISNLAMVAFFVMNRPQKAKKDNGPRSYMQQSLKSEIGFNDEQLKRFDTLAKAHRKEIHALFQDLNHSKEEFYRLLNTGNTSDSLLQKAANEIGTKQEILDIAIFRHFQSIRELSTPEQQPKLDSLIQRVVKRMISPGRKGGKSDSTRDKKPN